MNKIKIGLCQMKVQENKELNIEKAEDMINKAVNMGAQVVMLPEMFNCPYDNRYFPLYAEKATESITCKRISRLAKKKSVYIIAGSIPEKDDENNIYNTSFVFDREGDCIGKHRKIHLFDIDVKDGIRFMESEVLSPGKDITVFDTEFGKMGVAICYDIRFPELIRLMSMEGVNIVFIPAAFNMITGPAHWEHLFRVRALDNQIFMVGTAPAQNKESNYKSYGHSLIVDPWGSVIKQLDYSEDVIVQEIDLDMIHKIREELPLLKHMRKDIYRLSHLG